MSIRQNKCWFLDQAVERGDLELVIRLTGEVINDRSVTLTALVDGQVSRVATAMGERVEAGQVLAAMDNRAAAAAWEVAKADLRLAEVTQEWQQVRAPFDAVVVGKSTEVGQWVKPGQQVDLKKCEY